ncbi:hypothetical protein P9112_000797 [Eukaryota sp. TZLM1-RC]
MSTFNNAQALQKEKEMRRRTRMRQQRIAQMSMERRHKEEAERDAALAARRHRIYNNASAIRSHSTSTLHSTPSSKSSTKSVLSLSSRGSKRYHSAPAPRSKQRKPARYQRLITADYRKRVNPDDDVIKPTYHDDDHDVLPPVNSSITDVPLGSLLSQPSLPPITSPHPYALLHKVNTARDEKKERTNLSIEEQRLLQSIAKLDDRLKAMTQKQTSVGQKQTSVGQQLEENHGLVKTQQAKPLKSPKKQLPSITTNQNHHQSKPQLVTFPSSKPNITVVSRSKLSGLIKNLEERPSNPAPIVSNLRLNQGHSRPNHARGQSQEPNHSFQNPTLEDIANRIENYTVPFKVLQKTKNETNHSNLIDEMMDDVPEYSHSSSSRDSSPSISSRLETFPIENEPLTVKTNNKSQKRPRTDQKVPNMTDLKDEVEQLPENVTSIKDSLLFSHDNFQNVIDLNQNLKNFLIPFINKSSVLGYGPKLEYDCEVEFIYEKLWDGVVFAEILAEKLPRNFINLKRFKLDEVENNWKILRSVLENFDFELDDEEFQSILIGDASARITLYELICNLNDLFE